MSSPFAHLFLISPERMLRDLLTNHLRAAAPDLTISEFDSVSGIEPQTAPRGAVIMIADARGSKKELLDSVEAANAVLPDSPVAVLSSLSNCQVRHLLDLGVRGLVSTQLPAETLIHALRVLFAGGDFMSPMLVERGGLASSEPVNRSSRSPSPFSKTEEEILFHLNQGKPNKMIGAALGLSENAVKGHLRQLMRRFAARNRVELVLKTSAIARPQEE